MNKDTSVELTENDEESTLFGLPLSTIGTPLILLLISQFILFIGVGAVIPTLPLYGKEVGLSAAASGIVVSTPAVAMLLLANWAGKNADKARKPAMIIGMAVIAASDFGTSVAPNLAVLLIARLGLGIGRSVSESGERGMLADLAGRAPELRGRALAAQQAVIALGIAIGAPLGGYVVEQYGVRASFLCVTAAALSAMVIYTFLPETIGKTEEEDGIIGSKKSKNYGLATGDVGVPSDETAEWSKLLSDNQWRGLSLCQCGASFGFAAKIATIPVLAASVLPGGAVGAGALLSAAGLSGLIGAPIGGWLTDRAGPRVSASLAGLTSAAGLILVPVALSPWIDLGDDIIGGFSGDAAAFTALIILWSIGAAAQGPALTALAQELAPTGAEATAMALPRATGDGTYIVAPFVLGLVADATTGVVPGAECAVAGAATLVGVVGLVLLSGLDNVGKVTSKA
eukprot:CAMPEP_0185738030 /NCGR_PEP_ID=MMETSP1171-20130828/31861_1 /TAXON_ID=374046 /ORGANISM="Helicotheca tamensis, Strain CCMP826" /LENGTH=456 /DNA_ID=CAMNT_0028409119 /DNA_START=247 /DNA_END=1617 /DNA_ORIENTATION=+